MLVNFPELVKAVKAIKGRLGLPQAEELQKFRTSVSVVGEHRCVFSAMLQEDKSRAEDASVTL